MAEHLIIVNGSCVRISMDIPEFSESVDLAVTIEAKSHSWCISTVDGKVEGKSVGQKCKPRSGTFDDISKEEREQGMFNLVSTKNGMTEMSVNQHTAELQSKFCNIWQAIHCAYSSPNCCEYRSIVTKYLKDNVYAYGRATFDWLNQNVPYDYGAGVQARSGEICLVDGLGDCDEQSNAFMSIMRVKGVPTWYAFGALTRSSI